MSQYAAHYATLHDEALIDMALRNELLPEAKTALEEELRRRGIADLSTERQAREAEHDAEERHRKDQIATKSRVSDWRSKFLHCCAALCVAYGVYRFFNRNPDRPGDDGGLMVVLGIAMSLFAVVLSFLSRVWVERVTHRRPPQ